MNQIDSFGGWLRRRRRALDWTQAELAKQVGCAVGTIRKIEADELRPSKQLAEILSQRLDVPPKDRENFVRFARGVLRDTFRASPLVGQTQSLATTLPEVRQTHNLPAQVTNFFGRQREITEAQQLLATTRLLTLTGAGGTGKTRLALKVAEDLFEKFPDGIWFIELAPLVDPALIAQGVAAALALREREGTTLESILKGYLVAKNLLLILDNCEHLVAACAQFADTFLHACPHIKILATSREMLGISGETTFRVPSLETPNPKTQISITDLSHYSSILLFLDRAKMIQPSFRIMPKNAPVIAKICYRLDGIPLAIELAAGRVKGLQVEQIAERLDDRFRLLTIGSRTALPRQQTLRATMDWSYNLLPETESKLLQRLSAFAGGWTLGAAEEICSGDGIGTNDVLDLLSHLIDKSFVVVDERAEGQAARYRMLETIRQYAHEKLLASGESEKICGLHLDFYLKFAEDTATKLRGPEQRPWFYRLESEHDNLRTALAWSLEKDADSVERAMRLAGALVWFWVMQGYVNEGRAWLERFLEDHPPTPARAMPLVGLAIIEYFVGSLAKCSRLCAESLSLFQQQGDKWGIALSAVFGAAAESDPSRAGVLFDQARLHAQDLQDEWLTAGTDVLQGGYSRRRGNLLVARSFFESALDHARRSGDQWMIGNALENLGLVALEQNDNDRAAMLFKEGLDLHREMGDKHQIANDLYGLAMVATHRLDCQQARALLKQAILSQRELGDTRAIIECLYALGRVAAIEQQYERAARLLSAAQALGEKLGAAPPPVHRLEYQSFLDSVRAQLDQATFNAAWNEGHAMLLEPTIEYALA